MAKEATKIDKDLVLLSHLKLRFALGILGLLLPTVLVASAILGYQPIGRSISIYYFTPHLGQFLTGALWAIGMFLLFYEGHSKIPDAFRKLPAWLTRYMSDARLTTAAGFLALVTAVVPTSETSGQGPLVTTLAGIHLGAAAGFLSILAIMAIWVFTESDKPRAQWDQAKIWSNRVYVICGVTIFVSLAGAGLSFAAKRYWPDTTAVFWFEGLAIFAFGIAWLVKSKAIEKAAAFVASLAAPKA